MCLLEQTLSGAQHERIDHQPESVDHVSLQQGLSEGGRKDVSNLALLCCRCKVAKGGGNRRRCGDDGREKIADRVVTVPFANRPRETTTGLASASRDHETPRAPSTAS
ncbi:MAG: HNH endonuclease [Chloroflexi bacterium]|nr:MAG: HNH endonuclease [Chloroflexota bacterium]